MTSLYKEKLLIHRIQHDGDAQAFGELYDLYIARIYRFIAIKVSRREVAEDLTSDVFLKTWNYLTQDVKGKGIPVKSFSGLVYRIARTTLVDYYRSKQKHAEIGLDSLEHMGEDSPEIARIQLHQETDKVLAVMKTMKREYQEVILLKYIEELSTGEIADILQKNKTNVRVTLHRAMKILKQKLENGT